MTHGKRLTLNWGVMLTICSDRTLGCTVLEAADTPPCRTAETGAAGGIVLPPSLFATPPVFFRLDFATALTALTAVLPVVIIAALLAALFAFLFQIWDIYKKKIKLNFYGDHTIF